MKMKKLVIAAICAVGVFALSGCGDNVALTNEQNDIIAEYVAGALLMHSYDNEWKYTKLNSAQDAGYSTQKALKAELNAASSTGNAQTTAAGAFRPPHKSPWKELQQLPVLLQELEQQPLQQQPKAYQKHSV